MIASLHKIETKLWINVCGNVLTEGKNRQLQFFKEEYQAHLWCSACFCFVHGSLVLKHFLWIYTHMASQQIKRNGFWHPKSSPPLVHGLFPSCLGSKQCLLPDIFTALALFGLREGNYWLFLISCRLLKNWKLCFHIEPSEHSRYLVLLLHCSQHVIIFYLLELLNIFQTENFFWKLLRHTFQVLLNPLRQHLFNQQYVIFYCGEEPPMYFYWFPMFINV